VSRESKKHDVRGRDRDCRRVHAEHIQLKVGLIDEYKRKPADPTVKRNDVAGIVQIEVKL
jgi:hypothetical protein